jgi:hypothetical protein
MKYLIFTENEGSKWNDVTGVHYHFPLSKYRNQILEGSRFIYYKGSMQGGKKGTPYYFGTGVVGPVSIDSTDPKAAYCRIVDYRAFQKPVSFKIDGQYLEDPQGRDNYWRDGVREITEAIFQKILALTDTFPLAMVEEEEFQEELKTKLTLDENILRRTTQGVERPEKYTATATLYKRNAAIAALALLRAKGVCERCENQAPFVKADGRPFLEVHHIQPLAEGGADTILNTIALCPNCHRYLHYAVDAKVVRENLVQKIRGKEEGGLYHEPSNKRF